MQKIIQNHFSWTPSFCWLIPHTLHRLMEGDPGGSNVDRKVQQRSQAVIHQNTWQSQVLIKRSNKVTVNSKNNMNTFWSGVSVFAQSNLCSVCSKVQLSFNTDTLCWKTWESVPAPEQRCRLNPKKGQNFEGTAPNVSLKLSSPLSGTEEVQNISCDACGCRQKDSWRSDWEMSNALGECMWDAHLSPLGRFSVFD